MLRLNDLPQFNSEILDIKQKLVFSEAVQTLKDWVMAS